MNKFEKITRDYEKLKHEFEFLTHQKRKTEKENLKLRKHIKIFKVKLKRLEEQNNSLSEELDRIDLALID